MPVGDYYQRYGPIHRRRQQQEHEPDEQEDPTPPPRRRARRRPSERPEYSEPVVGSARERIESRRQARRRTRRRPRRPSSPVRTVVLLVAVLLALFVGLPAAVYASYNERAFPGVSVQGVDVSHMHRSDIQATIAARYRGFLEQPVTLALGDHTWTPTLAELGVDFALSDMVAAALEPGRSGNVFNRLGEVWTVWRNGEDIAPRLTVDQQQMQTYLLSLGTNISQPPRDAALSIAYGRVIATPANPGLQLLIEENANELLRSLSTLEPQRLVLRTRVLEPTITNEVLAVAEQEARDMLAAPLLLYHNQQSWQWEAEELADLLYVQTSPGTMTVEVDNARLLQAVERLAVSVDSGSVDPRVRFENGTLAVVQNGQTGWRLQQEAAAQVISTTLQQATNPTRTVQLPADQLTPRISPETLPELGIVELLAEGKSSFAGSAAYRITNIKAGAARMDGVLIAPGEEFSFNTQLGEVNETNGFVEGYAVVGNRTKLEWGGGVCQDSTTVFRAAFWAGLPITEWHPHPFYISWYDRFGLGPFGDGAGLDAAIYTGLNDLKFVNDTGNWILMQVIVDEVNQVLTVQLYGTRPNGRRVAIEGPYITNEVPAPASPVYIDDPSQPVGYFYQSDAARNGRDITIYRVVTENGEEIRRDTFFTRFKAWPNVYVRGTGSG